MLLEWIGVNGWVIGVWLVYLLTLVTWIVLQKRDPAATLAWIMALAALPVVGFVVFYVFGPRRIKRHRLKRMGSSKAFGDAMTNSDAMAASDAPREQIVRHADLVQKTCAMPLVTASSVRLLVDGAATYDALCEAIAAATHHVHLEYYIFADDTSGTRVLDALVARARAGVEVRLLIDGAGSLKTDNDFFEPLRDAGGETAVFHHVWGLAGLRPHFNFRSHRKICVIDATVAFAGGVNITDDENSTVKPDDYFHDVHLRMEGAVANHLQRVFLEDWHYATKKLPEPDRYVRMHPAGEYALQVIASGPDCRWEPTHRAFVDSIHAATRRVWITTPYFVPTEAALMALTSAAMRGVDVRVMVPDKSDTVTAKLAARSFYEEVLEAGVRVFEYQPRMLHSKTMLMDDAFAIVGTSNFDNRSFRLNFEVDIAIHEREIVDALEAVWIQDQKECLEVERKRPPAGFVTRLKEGYARLLAPML